MQEDSGLKMFLHVKVTIIVYEYYALICKIICSSCIHVIYSTVGIQCPALSDPENGAVRITGTGVGDTATYTCISGYELSCSDTRLCGSNGEWSGSAPTCEGKYSMVQLLLDKT